jgi:hypothetical protein
VSNDFHFRAEYHLEEEADFSLFWWEEQQNYMREHLISLPFFREQEIPSQPLKECLLDEASQS